MTAEREASPVPDGGRTVDYGPDFDDAPSSPLARAVQRQWVHWPWYAMGASGTAIGATVLAASHGGFGSLAVGVVGEMAGTVLLAGVVAPFARRAYRRQTGLDHKSGFPYDEYLRQLRRAKHRVQILDTFTYMLVRDITLATNGHGVRGIRHSAEFIDALTHALENDVAVQILLLDPESVEVTRRAEALEVDPDAYRLLIEANISELRRLRPKAAAGSLDVRLYKAPPGISMHRCDDRMWLSFYPITGRAFDSPHLELMAGTQNALFLKRRFNDLYEHGRRLW